jgi:hypothetical protein
MEFSDPKQNAEWQRIGQEIKKALKQARPADTGSHFAEELSKIARTKPRKIPIRAIAAACAMLLVVGAVIVWKMHVPPPPPPVSEAQIQIAKAPPAASVSIDGGAPQPTDAKGGLKVPNLKPGQHEVVVSKPGYETFTDTVEVGSGETFREDVLLTPLPPAGAKTGTFTPSPQGGLTEVKVFVDGVSYGVKPAGAKITLKIGAHTVKYAWPGYQDSKDHTIQIAQDTNVQDPFTLDKSVPPPPSTGRLTIQTTPEAQIAIDGHNVGSADSSGSYTVQELSGGQHSVDISLDKYQPVNRTVTIAAGQTLPLSAPLTPVPPPLQPSGTLNVSANSIEKGKSVQLTWDVKNASTVSISNYGDGLGPRGSVPVYPTATTTYQLTANGTQLDQKTVTVSEPAPPPVAVEPPAKPVAPARPDREALEPALNPYKSLFAGAAAKGSKGCKAALNGAYQGGLSGWAKWCDDAKSFEASVANCHAGGSADAPTLTCTETITIHPRDGDPSQTTATKTFHFAKGQDGSWKISGWQ